jgi:hypothetical protein
MQIAFLLLFLTVNLLAQAEKPTRIYLVRHAEKSQAIERPRSLAN